MKTTERFVNAQFSIAALVKYSFTLIELLIVVAIIAILAGLLMPALNSARGKARAIKCTNNLKQMGIGFFCYVNDNNDLLPPLDDEDKQNKWPTRMKVGKYFPIRVLVCPEVSASVNLTGSGTNKNWYQKNPHYGTYYNGILLHAKSVKMSSVNNTSRKIFLVDVMMGNPDGEVNINTGCYRWFNKPGQAADQYGVPSARHNSNVNTLYLDGHAGQIRVNNWLTPCSAAPFRYANAEDRKILIWNY